MNNQAFRKLVYQQTSKTINKKSKNDDQQQQQIKSTKEIARDAVEQEFNELKRKRKFGSGGEQGGRRGGGRFFDGDFDMSDDDNDIDTDMSNNKKNEGHLNDEEEIMNNKKNTKGGQRKKYKSGNKNNNHNSNQEHSSKYRDRAKERREGKSLDYLAAESLNLPNNNDHEDVHSKNADIRGHTTKTLNDMTKYLGGDEQFTHLVKGLDRTLADKVRREEMNTAVGSSRTLNSINDTNNIDLDQLMEDAQTGKTKQILAQQDNESYMIQTKMSSSSTLVSTMASYLHKIKSNETSTNIFNDMTTIHSHHNKVALNTAGQTLHRSILSFSLNNIKRHKAWEIPTVTIHGTNTSALNDMTTCTPVDRELIQKIKLVLESIKTNKKKNHLDKDEAKQEGNRNNCLVQNVDDEQKDDSDDDIYDDVGDYVPPIIDSRKMKSLI